MLIDHLMYLQGCLEEVGTKIEDEEIVTQALQGLLPSYSEVVIVLIMSKQLTINKLRSTLRAFHKRQMKTEMQEDKKM